MKKRTLSLILLLMIVIAVIALFLGGDYSSYNLVYIFSFIFLFFFTLFSSSTAVQKIITIVIYALIMVAQILVNTYLIRPLEGPQIIYQLNRLLGVLLVFIPFLVERLFSQKRMNIFMALTLEEPSAIPYSLLLYDRDALVSNIERIRNAGKVLSRVHLDEIIQYLPRHSSFSYVNNGSLTDEYFRKACSALDDGYMHLVVAKTKTAPSEFLGLFTGRQYNHVSISFDKDLHTAVSYNGGQKVAPPGMNPELLEQLTQNNGSAVLVYRLPASREQKRMILDQIKEINTEGSAYNLLGLALKFSYQPNIMFCSQFVYTMLKCAGLQYFEMRPAQVKPSDFVELDYYRKLEFAYEISLRNTDFVNGECGHEQKIF